MNTQVRPFVQGAVFALGLATLIGGLAAGMMGASLIGLIVAAVSYRNWQEWRRA